tara:strand:- start:283 stop:603 length:321 start_codon:yes stop_codon:yes gene_type:complete
MEHLFTKTSKVLRDNWVLELQKSNDFLRNKLSNINYNPFFGYKIRVRQHFNGMTQTHVPETYGVIYTLTKGTIWFLAKNDNDEKIMKRAYINNVDFIDERFDSFFE